MKNQQDKITIWWIDDDHADKNGIREAERNALVGQAGSDLDLVPIHPADFEKHALDLEKNRKPDLLLIDFRLGNNSQSGCEPPFFTRDGVTLRGTTLGNKALKDVPAYLVSRVIKESQTGTCNEQFDWILSYQQLIDELGGKFLLDDARDYRELQKIHDGIPNDCPNVEIQKTLVKGILKLLQVPPDSTESMENIVRYKVANLLQSESRLDSDEIQLSPSRPRAIARWIRSAMLKFRGPLIDERSAANMVGTKLKYFTDNVKFNFEPARYTGIFQRTASMTIWRQEFIHLLLSESETIELSSPTKLAKSASAYFEIPKDQIAVCRVCGESWPETIAVDEDDQTVEAAVHWRCSNETTNIESLLGFEIIRSFSESKP